MQVAEGTFEVEITPAHTDALEGTSLGRMTLAKTFSGAIEGKAAGEMLTAVGDPRGSASYVAVERVEGSIDGRSGSFMLVHRGIMSAAGQQLEIQVSPDSGTGELKGLAGVFHLTVDGGVHHYRLEYTLEA